MVKIVKFQVTFLIYFPNKFPLDNHQLKKGRVVFLCLNSPLNFCDLGKTFPLSYSCSSPDNFEEICITRELWTLHPLSGEHDLTTVTPQLPGHPDGEGKGSEM